MTRIELRKKAKMYLVQKRIWDYEGDNTSNIEMLTDFTWSYFGDKIEEL